MSSRLLRWIILGFTCLWFGMLVPVHQRGQIQLPGSAGFSAVASCCSNRPDAQGHKATPGKQKPGTPVNRENCAVCQLILGLHAPPPVTWYVERLGLIASLPVEQHLAVPHCAEVLPFHGRAPPTV